VAGLAGWTSVTPCRLSNPSLGLYFVFAKREGMADYNLEKWLKKAYQDRLDSPFADVTCVICDNYVEDIRDEGPDLDWHLYGFFDEANGEVGERRVLYCGFCNKPTCATFAAVYKLEKEERPLVDYGGHEILCPPCHAYITKIGRKGLSVK
jgi:hypothetical protein